MGWILHVRGVQGRSRTTSGRQVRASRAPHRGGARGEEGVLVMEITGCRRWTVGTPAFEAVSLGSGVAGPHEEEAAAARG